MTTEPFIPKSAAKLTHGDFALLPRDDGQYVPLVFLAPVLNKRVVFWGALLSEVCADRTFSETGSEVELWQVAMIDIDVFTEANAPVLGNLSPRLNAQEVDARLSEMRTHSRVWGRRTPLKYANELAV